MPITVTIRQGVAAVGGLLAVAGLFVLLWPVAVVMDTGPFGLSEQASCGSALVTHDTYGGLVRAACAEPLSDQRMFGWPLLLGGIAIVAAALYVHVTPTTREDV